MNTPKATLGGIPIVATTPVSWRFKTGTEPYTRVFEFHEKDAAAMTSMVTGQKSSTSGPKGNSTFVGSSIQLRIEPSEGQPLVVDNVWVIGEAPSSQPFLRAFVVADCRWLWKRFHPYRFFNVPRRTGKQWLVGGVPTQIANLDFELKYVQWSLKDGKPWTAKDVLKSIADEVVGNAYTIKDEPEGDTPIQGFEIDEPGDVAVGNALAHIPGHDVFIDRKGRAIFFNARDVVAGAHLVESIKRVEGSMSPRATDMRYIRPSKIFVLFNRESELRFDSTMEDDTQSQGAGANELYMENVLPIPDDQLTIQGRLYGRGMWITFREAFSAWNQSLPDGAPPLTFAILQRLFIRGQALEAIYDSLGVRKPDANWAARIAAIRAHYRVTYRINPKWTKHIKVFRDYRLALFDPITGVRSKAVVMADYAVRCSWRGLKNQGDEQFIVMNVEGYPGIDGKPDKDGKPAPANVTVIDSDQGIIHLDFRRDLLALWQSVFPSKIVDDTGKDTSVTVNTGAWKTVPIGFDCGVKGAASPVQLSPHHRVCVVLAAAPGAPNDTSLLHSVEVKIEDAAKPWSKMGKAAQGGDGVPWYLRFGANIQARILWDQSKKDLYQLLFGLATNKGGLDQKTIEALLINKEVLDEGALAVAQSLWSEMLSKYEGTRTSHWDPDQTKDIVGNVDIVEHTLLPSGQLLSSWTANPSLRSLDASYFMGSSTRTALLGILPSGVLGK